MFNWKRYSALALLGGISSLAVLGGGKSATAQVGSCEKEIILQSVEVLDGQGAGEGKLEMEISTEIGSLSKNTKAWKISPGGSRNPEDKIGTLKINESRTNPRLSTKIVEKEVSADAFVGGDDYGSKETFIDCRSPEEVTQRVNVGGNNTAKVNVTYEIRDVSPCRGKGSSPRCW